MGRNKKQDRPAKQQVLLCWSFPSHGWYKLNVDGSYRSGLGSIAAGGVIRNQDGEWLSGFAANLGTGNKVMEAELLALYRGLELAWKSGWAPLEVESDSTSALRLLNNPVEVNKIHPQFNLIKSCQDLLNQNWRCSLNHAYKQQNSVADCLANFGLAMELGCHYFDVPPRPCVPFLVQDLCRVARPRNLRPSVIECRSIKKLEELDFHMEDFASVLFTWKIDNFSKLDAVKHYSDVFVIGVFEWRILIHPRGNNVDYLSVYLDVTGSSTLPSGWGRHARFSLTILNQLQISKSLTKETQHVFTKKESVSGFTSLIPLSEFCDHIKGYLVNDVCIIEAKVAVLKSEIKLLEDPDTCRCTPIKLSDKEHRAPGCSSVDSMKFLDSSVPCRPLQAILEPNRSAHACTKPTDVPAAPPVVNRHEEVSSAPAGELVDFRGLGKMEKAFVPLLDEVCSWHPSLIECQRKRSHMFTEWAFTALGRLLHFLKTKKAKDMTGDACEHLQLLWEELGAFRFDLAWLEPRVQRALGMKKIVERAGNLKRLKEDVVAFDMQTRRLRAELAVAEANLVAAITDLDKTQEDLHEIDMDRELGYASG